MVIWRASVVKCERWGLWGASVTYCSFFCCLRGISRFAVALCGPLLCPATAWGFYRLLYGVRWGSLAGAALPFLFSPSPQQQIPPTIAGRGYSVEMLDDDLLSHGEAPHYHRR